MARTIWQFLFGKGHRLLDDEPVKGSESQQPGGQGKAPPPPGGTPR